MGFGSYDESEQQKREVTEEPDDSEDVTPDGDGHDGEFSFEMEGSTDDMLGQLRDIKASAETEADDE